MHFGIFEIYYTVKRVACFGSFVFIFSVPQFCLALPLTPLGFVSASLLALPFRPVSGPLLGWKLSVGLLAGARLSFRFCLPSAFRALASSVFKFLFLLHL